MSKLGIEHPRFGELRVMWWIMGASLIAYGISILFVALSQTFPKPVAPPRHEPVRWIKPGRDHTSIGLRQQIIELNDPSLLALPHPRGFSSSMWQQTAPCELRITTWRVPESFLTYEPPAPFDCIVGQPAINELVRSAVQKAAPDTGLSAVGIVPMSSPLNETAFQITGPLASRALVHRPELPSMLSETPLRMTRLFVWVSADGLVRHVALERSCGNETADAQAMQAAGQFRFEPLDGDPTSQALTIGLMFILWNIKLPPP